MTLFITQLYWKLVFIYCPYTKFYTINKKYNNIKFKIIIFLLKINYYLNKKTYNSHKFRV